MYWPEEQAVSVVGKSAIVSPDAVTAGCDAQVRVGRATHPGIISAIGKFRIRAKVVHLGKARVGKSC